LASWRADGPKWFVPGEEPAPLTCWSQVTQLQ
jgi:hypothetical protein